MNEYRFKFRTPYYLPDPDGKDQFVGFEYWDARQGRPEMMVTWGPDEQCTGVSDKNGKLIYEGDIVIKTDSNALGYKRVRKCVVVWDDNSAAWAIDTEFGDRYLLSEFSSEQIECIGNIHETKEA